MCWLPWITLGASLFLAGIWYLSFRILPSFIPSPLPYKDTLWGLPCFSFGIMIPWTWMMEKAGFLRWRDELRPPPRLVVIRRVEDLQTVLGEQPFVLYLRNSSLEMTLQYRTYETPERDVLYRIPGTSIQDIGTVPAKKFTHVKERTTDELLTQVTPIRVVALITKGDPTPHPKIQYIFAEEVSWTAIIRPMLQQAACVVLYVYSLSEGLQYELSCIKDFGLGPRVLALIPYRTSLNLPIQTAESIYLEADGGIDALRLGAALNRIIQAAKTR